MLQLAVILPTFNERKNIAPMVERLDAALKGLSWEAIFVDDNSPDGTAEEARRIGRGELGERVGAHGLDEQLRLAGGGEGGQPRVRGGQQGARARGRPARRGPGRGGSGDGLRLSAKAN